MEKDLHQQMQKEDDEAEIPHLTDAHQTKTRNYQLVSTSSDLAAKQAINSCVVNEEPIFLNSGRKNDEELVEAVVRPITAQHHNMNKNGDDTELSKHNIVGEQIAINSGLSSHQPAGSMTPSIHSQSTPKGPYINKKYITIVKKQRPNNNGRRSSAGSLSASRSALSSEKIAVGQKAIGCGDVDSTFYQNGHQQQQVLLSAHAGENNNNEEQMLAEDFLQQKFQEAHQEYTINETQIELFLPYSIEQNLFPPESNLIETRKKRRQSRKPNKLNEEEIIFTQFETSGTSQQAKNPPASRNVPRNHTGIITHPKHAQQQQLSIVKDLYSQEQTFAERGSTGRQTPLLKTPPLHCSSSINNMERLGVGAAMSGGRASVNSGGGNGLQSPSQVVPPSNAASASLAKVIAAGSAGRAPRPQSKRNSNSQQSKVINNKIGSAPNPTTNVNNGVVTNQHACSPQQMPPHQQQSQQHQHQPPPAASTSQHVRQLTCSSSVFESQMLESTPEMTSVNMKVSMVEAATPNETKIAIQPSQQLNGEHNGSSEIGLDTQSANMSEFLVTYPTYNIENTTVSADIQNQYTQKIINGSEDGNDLSFVQQQKAAIPHQPQHRHTLLFKPALQLAPQENNALQQQSTQLQNIHRQSGKRNSCELRVTIQLQPPSTDLLNQPVQNCNPTNITVPSHPFPASASQTQYQQALPSAHKKSIQQNVNVPPKLPSSTATTSRKMQNRRQQQQQLQPQRKALNFAENLSKLMLANKMQEKIKAKKSLTRICSDQNLLTRMSKESNILNSCTKENKSLSKDVPPSLAGQNGTTLTRGLKRQETISSNFGSSGQTPKPEVDSVTAYSMQKSEKRKVYLSQHGTRERHSQGCLPEPRQSTDQIVTQAVGALNPLKVSARTLSRQKVNSQQYSLSKKGIIQPMSRTAHKIAEQSQSSASVTNGRRGAERRDKNQQPLQIIDELVKMSSSSRQIIKSHREMKASPQQSLNSRHSQPNQKSPPVENNQRVINKLKQHSKSNKRRQLLIQTATANKKQQATSVQKIKSNKSDDRSDKQTTSKKTLKPAASSNLNFSEEALFKLIKAINGGSDNTSGLQQAQSQVSPRMQSPPPQARLNQNQQPFTYRKSATFKLQTATQITHNSQAFLQDHQSSSQQQNQMSSCATSTHLLATTNNRDSQDACKQKSWDNVVMSTTTQSFNHHQQQRSSVGFNNNQAAVKSAKFQQQQPPQSNTNTIVSGKKQKQPTQGCAANSFLTGQSKNGSSDPTSSHHQLSCSQPQQPQPVANKRQQHTYKIRNGGRNASLPGTLPSEPQSNNHHNHFLPQQQHQQNQPTISILYQQQEQQQQPDRQDSLKVQKVASGGNSDIPSQHHLPASSSHHLLGGVENAYQTGQRQQHQQHQNNQTQHLNHPFQQQNQHHQPQHYVRQLSDRSHQPQSKRGPLLDNRAAACTKGYHINKSKHLLHQHFYMNRRVAQGSGGGGGSSLPGGDSTATAISQQHNGGVAQSSNATTSVIVSAAGVNNGSSKVASSKNLLLVPTAQPEPYVVPRQDMARHPHTCSTFSQISGSSKNKPLNRAAAGNDSLHQKLLKKTEKHASMEKTVLRNSLPTAQLNQQQSQPTIQTLSMSNHRNALKNAAFLSPKAGGRQVTSSGGLTFTSQTDSLVLKAALSSHKAARENRVNSNIALSSTTSNLNNVASSSVIDFHNVYQQNKAQAQAFSPPATRSNVQLRQANPYKSNHQKRILEEHYNIKTKDELQNGHPVFKLTKNHTNGQATGQHQRPQTSHILKGNNNLSNQKPRMLLRNKAPITQLVDGQSNNAATQQQQNAAGLHCSGPTATTVEQSNFQ